MCFLKSFKILSTVYWWREEDPFHFWRFSLLPFQSYWTWYDGKWDFYPMSYDNFYQQLTGEERRVPFILGRNNPWCFGYGNRLDRCGERGVYLSELCSTSCVIVIFMSLWWVFKIYKWINCMIYIHEIVERHTCHLYIGNWKCVIYAKYSGLCKMKYNMYMYQIIDKPKWLTCVSHCSQSPYTILLAI